MNSLPLHKTLLLLCALGLFHPCTAFAQLQRDSLTPTPPMGWNSWNKFQCNVSEDLIKSVADSIATNGMKEAGYEYVVIDDCWQVSRDDNGNIVADAQHFPSGMKALADYVHSKGLKFGIYSDAGTKTCAGRPASQGHEYQDALQYSRWEIDYLKYDWCHTSTQDAKASYTNIRAALDRYSGQLQRDQAVLEKDCADLARLRKHTAGNPFARQQVKDQDFDRQPR